MTTRIRAIILAAATAVLCSHSGAAQSAVPRTTDDSLALMTAMYRAAFTNGIRTAHARATPGLVCVAAGEGDAPGAIITALADSTSLLVRPRSACRIESLISPSTGNSLVLDTLTGRRGIVISVKQVAFDMGAGFSFRTTYYENGRSGADWACTGRRTGSRWEVLSCRITRIS